MQNLLNSIRLGFAEGIDFRIMTTKTIKEKLLKVLEDPKYAENVKKLSTRFKDQKEHPLERAVWWVEWLMRNPNANEVLKSPVLRLGIFSGNSFDLIVLITLSVLAILLVLTKLLFSYTCQLAQDTTHRQNYQKEE